jgi:hypothetical protein
MIVRCVPKRYLVTALAFVGCFSMYNLRITLGMALVEMTSERTIMVGDQIKKIVSKSAHDNENLYLPSIERLTVLLCLIV